MAKKSRAHNVKESLTGLRVAKMCFQEFFGWSYQDISAENDDGLDGLVMVRDKNGNDTGGRIYVQVKSGPSYVHVCKDGTLSINAYAKDSYVKHQKTYDSMTAPVVLIFVNAHKTIAGKDVVNLYRPSAWWLKLNGYRNLDGKCVYRIDPRNTFGEHSIRDFKKLVGENNRQWQDYGKYCMSTEDKRLWRCCGDLRGSAKQAYQEWKDSNPTVNWCSIKSGERHIKNVPLIVSNMGWHHINKGSRGAGLIQTSLRLLSVVRNILSEEISPIEIRRGYTGIKASEIFYAVRRLVHVDNKDYKVQIILRRWVNAEKANPALRDRLWFYSVHIIKD